jgi:hypothetical protein
MVRSFSRCFLSGFLCLSAVDRRYRATISSLVRVPSRNIWKRYVTAMDPQIKELTSSK